jgi:serine protease Do
MFRRCICLLTFAGHAAAFADVPTIDSWQIAAQKLQHSTATIRIWTEKTTLPAFSPPGRDSQELASSVPAVVTVCSGVCVAEGLVITTGLPSSDAPIRLTFPSGKQSDAKVLVIDEYSGLALLKADTNPLVALATAGALPAVGTEILTAAAWGLEPPLVSRGIIGGIDRIDPGRDYPPLVQCDCMATSTSIGSGLVDRAGKLIGIVVAADRGPQSRGWTYAVPVSHVQRVLRAASDQRADGVLILKRRRPLVGMVLDQDGDAIVVSRLTPGGPAEKAGIKPGDQIIATDGVAIRSVYQAVLPTLHKQPGDITEFQLYRDGVTHDISVILGGGVELDAASTRLVADLVQPKIRLSRTVDGAIVANRSPSAPAAVSVLPPLPNDGPPPAASVLADQIALLEKSLTRYQAVIELQQRQLADHEQQRRQQEALLQTLRAEIDSLRRAISK